MSSSEESSQNTGIPIEVSSNQLSSVAPLPEQMSEIKAPHNPKYSQDFSIEDTESPTAELNQKKTSNFGGITNLFKCYVGTGILALPYSFNEAGYLYSVLFLLVLGLIVYYTNVLLVKAGEKLLKPGEDYSDMCDKVLSPSMAFVMRVFFVFGAITACISYVIFFVTFFEHALGDALPTYVYLGFALLIILPMSFINKLGGLVKFSFVANTIISLTIVSILVINFVEIFSDLDSPNGSWEKNSGNLINVEQAPLMIGVGLYAFDGIYVILGVRDSLKKPEQFTTRVLNVTNLIVAIFYIVFSCTSVMAKGHDMDEIMLFALTDHWYVSTLQILYAISLALSYPMFLLTAVQLMENQKTFVGRFINKAKENKTQLHLRRGLFRLFCTALIILTAFFIPRFAIAINLFGSVSGAALQFFLPLFSYYVAFKDTISFKQKYFNFVILTVGVGGCILGIYGSIAELL